MKTILITGGCGFVGSNLATAFKRQYPGYNILVADNLKRSGSELNIKRLKSEGIQFHHCDIRIKGDLEVFGRIDCLIEASAEPSVLAGIDGTIDYLIDTNLVGTINCLSYAAKYKSDFVFLSTSRVYPIQVLNSVNFEEDPGRYRISGNQSIIGVSESGINESFPLAGYRSFYGTTKLSSELMIGEFNHFHGLKTVVNRCGVITGPYQMGKTDQGVVVLWMARHFFNKKLAYFGYGGKGKQVRDILHVNDLFRLIDYQVHNIEHVNGKTFNVGGGNEISVSLKELTALCSEITGNRIPVESVTQDRTADIRIYITDNNKIELETGWCPKIQVNEILSDIYQWIRHNEQTLKNILDQ